LIETTPGYERLVGDLDDAYPIIKKAIEMIQKGIKVVVILYGE